MFDKNKDYFNIDDLLTIVKILRAPGGCPWDMEQNHASIRMDVLEEAYEVMEAIDSGEPELLREELGDLLLQIVFHAELETETGGFTFGDVCDGICKKLIVRHPHVFGEVVVSGTGEVLKNWDAIKSRGKGETTVTERLESVPKLLPALMRGEKIGRRAAVGGFDFENIAQVFTQLRSEIDELETAVSLGNSDNIEEELGDILFACTTAGRFLKKDCEKALTISLNKFIMRFRAVENQALGAGKNLAEMPAEEKDMLWQRAKSL